MRRAILSQAGFWLALWGFWVVVSRHNHPNLLLNAIATACLVVTFAVAFSLNHLWLIPRFWKPRQFVVYGLALLMVMGSLSLACTIIIHLVYDWLWGPDPARFGFWINFTMEFGLVSIHVFLVAASLWLYRRWSQTRQGDTRISAPL